ncbi:isoprenylcysteine carboxylmethyltransferase family protein [Spirosoma sp. BT702]|uniref:Isoprenylcysteine carboxylmethyltransferase family protein n=1 Tax=Spirosoma profusum TaxID=2771354 RepID=A0A926Y3C7_9BACT|nr:protein-S-isoprenylcysteine O-methyltransferase [Spirosoma profusum]MBD2701750.1 isoprenylcysteine carboxylmethyltransferase family protein [Spirosoma profusum]
MNQEFVFRILFMVCFVPGQLIRQYVVRKNPAGKLVKSVNIDRELLMYRIGTLLFIIPIFYALTTWLDFAGFYLPNWIRWVGFGVSLLGVVVLVLSHQALGRNWTGQLHIQENHVLIIRGIYRYIRHPMYLSFLLAAIGTLLLSANWFIGVPPFIWFWAMYLGRVNHEEQMMLDAFGEPYRVYMRSTGRLLPKIMNPAASR